MVRILVETPDYRSKYLGKNRSHHDSQIHDLPRYFAAILPLVGSQNSPSAAACLAASLCGTMPAADIEGALMATREHRLSEFMQHDPPPGQSLEILCEDHNGTYSLPFPCQWIGGSWRNANSGLAIDAAVVGWRAYR